MMNSIVRISLAAAAAVALVVTLAIVGPGTAAQGQAQSSSASAPAGKEVTIKCNILCQRAFEPPMGTCDGSYPLVLIALGGTPEIDATVKDLMKQYWPANGTLDWETAKKLDQAWCDKLKFFITPDTDNKALHKTYQVEYGSWYAEVTGAMSEKDGKKWFTVSKLNGVYNKNYETRDFVPKEMFTPDKPLKPCGKTPLTLKVADELTLKCVLLPAGKFYMGSPFYQVRYQDEFPHAVTLTKAYWMAEIPVTQEMYEAVMGKDKNKSLDKGPQMPVELTPVADIKEFCGKLSDLNKRTVRLPTDAELEYAMRVGNSNPCFHERYKDQFSDCAPKPFNVEKEGMKPASVKSKQPSAWGLYDLLCCGWTTDADFKSCNFREDQTDPTGPAKPVQQYSDPAGAPEPRKGPLYKSRGGWFYGKVRPNQHGANKLSGGYYEGTPIFRVVVEATADEIAELEKAQKNSS